MLSAVSLSFSPISEMLADTYGVPILEVNSCAIVFTATQIPMNFVAMWMYTKMPSHWVLRIACALFIIGAWTRT